MILENVIERLEDLQEHCESMIGYETSPLEINDWECDVQALSIAIKIIEKVYQELELHQDQRKKL